jgi:hypothetical protein
VLCFDRFYARLVSLRTLRFQQQNHWEFAGEFDSSTVLVDMAPVAPRLTAILHLTKIALLPIACTFAFPMFFLSLQQTKMAYWLLSTLIPGVRDGSGRGDKLSC